MSRRKQKTTLFSPQQTIAGVKWTSAAAKSEIESDGSAGAQRALCREAVRKCPGRTARELESLLGGLKAHKRLPELRGEGVVRNGTARKCQISGKMAQTWYLGDGNAI